MTSQNRTYRLVVLALRLVLAAVFLYGAWTKLRTPWELFAMSVDSYHVLPLRGVELVARTLPWAEALIGVFLLAGIFPRSTAVATSLLLLGFFGLMVRAFANGEEINCGCFGPGEIISWKTLLRDGTLLAAALALALMAFTARRKTA
jgi:uncharacterized membrane protein YphA (DoxX/SURF4 family)